MAISSISLKRAYEEQGNNLISYYEKQIDQVKKMGEIYERAIEEPRSEFTMRDFFESKRFNKLPFFTKLSILKDFGHDAEQITINVDCEYEKFDSSITFEKVAKIIKTHPQAIKEIHVQNMPGPQSSFFAFFWRLHTLDCFPVICDEKTPFNLAKNFPLNYQGLERPSCKDHDLQKMIEVCDPNFDYLEIIELFKLYLDPKREIREIAYVPFLHDLFNSLLINAGRYKEAESRAYLTTSPLSYHNHACISYNNNDEELAMHFNNRALDLDPDHPEALYDRAVFYFNRDEFQKALDDLNQCDMLWPNDPDVLKLRCLAYLYLGKVEESDEDFHRLEEMGRLDQKLFDDIFSHYYNNEDFENANLVNVKALKLFPTDPTLIGNEGLIDFKNEVFDEALNKLTFAVENGAREAAFYQRVCIIRSDRNEHKLALDAINQAIAIDPNYPQYLVDRAGCFFKMGMLDEAYRDAAAVIIDSENDFARLILAEIDLQKGKLEEAEWHISQVSAQVDDLFLLKAMLFIAKVNYRAAFNELKKVTDKDCRAAKLALRGHIYFNKKNMEKAQELLQKAEKIDPDCIDVIKLKEHLSFS